MTKRQDQEPRLAGETAAAAADWAEDPTSESGQLPLSVGDGPQHRRQDADPLIDGALAELIDRSEAGEPRLFHERITAQPPSLALQVMGDGAAMTQAEVEVTGHHPDARWAASTAQSC